MTVKCLKTPEWSLKVEHSSGLCILCSEYIQRAELGPGAGVFLAEIRGLGAARRCYHKKLFLTRKILVHGTKKSNSLWIWCWLGLQKFVVSIIRKLCTLLSSYFWGLKSNFRSYVSDSKSYILRFPIHILTPPDRDKLQKTFVLESCRTLRVHA